MRKATYISSFLLILLLSTCKEEKEEVKTTSKLNFVKQSKPVWEGTLTAADPSVIRDGDTLRMFYSSLVIDKTEQLVIASAKSVDGIHWTKTNRTTTGESIALTENPRQWDNHVEAVSVINHNNELWMYYCGYPVEADVAGTIVASGQIGVAKANSKFVFSRTSTQPVVALGKTNTKDANALFSPTLIKDQDTYYLFYVGYCIENCSPAFIGILCAQSTDGINWTKRDTPILSGVEAGLSWAQVIKEPAIVKGPDDMFYLFISGDKAIGVARSKNILGPYEVYPDPIIEKEFDWEASSVIAPSVLIENGKVRLWYMGVVESDTGADFAIGYAESDFPFDWQD